MRFALAALLVALAGCASHKNEAMHHSHAEMASMGMSCHGGGEEATMASAEGASCHAQAELASAEGAGCHAKAELASAEGASCHAKAELASAEGAEGHACGACPMKADGTCDHEAGAKAGRECCKKHLAATVTP